jgi:hypothetical protein
MSFGAGLLNLGNATVIFQIRTLAMWTTELDYNRTSLAASLIFYTLLRSEATQNKEPVLIKEHP